MENPNGDSLFGIHSLVQGPLNAYILHKSIKVNYLCSVNAFMQIKESE